MSIYSTEIEINNKNFSWDDVFYCLYRLKEILHLKLIYIRQEQTRLDICISPSNEDETIFIFDDIQISYVFPKYKQYYSFTIESKNRTIFKEAIQFIIKTIKNRQ